MPGVLVIQGMSLRIPVGAIKISLTADGAPGVGDPVVPQLRLDLWPTWLEAGWVRHARRANDVGLRLTSDLSDEQKAELLARELKDGLVAMCAFAFAFDGFYDVVKSELGEHPNASQWRQEGRRATPRHRQVAETFRYHLKLGPKFTAQLKEVLRDLFKFRGRAVHPSSAYETATLRVEIDSGVHPSLITFSGKHAVQCRAISLVLLDRLVSRAAELAMPAADVGWLDTGRREIDRLATEYRIPGDDEVAYPAVADPDQPGGESQGSGSPS